MEWVRLPFEKSDHKKDFHKRSRDRTGGAEVPSEQGRTEFSLQSTILLPNISLGEQGRYKCIATHNSSAHRQDTDAEKLHVAPIIPPWVNMTNMKGDSITPLEGTQHELICGICGRPKVEIEWSKDGLPINQTKYLSIDSGVGVLKDGQQRLINMTSLGSETDVQFSAWFRHWRIQALGS